MISLSAAEFARAYRQESAAEWTSIPAVITQYEASTQLATVQPLIKQIYRDASTHNLPIIYGVPIRTPRTAFAGLQLPVKVGDKVILIFTMRSLDNLLDADLSGHSIPDQVDPESNQLKNYNFCVGLAGFHDLASAIGTDGDVRLLNNWQSHTNDLRLEEDGSINLKNPESNIRMDISGEITANNQEATVNMTPDGEVTVTNPEATINMTPEGVITLTNPNSTIEMDETGTITADNGAAKITLSPLGAITMDVPTVLTIDCPFTYITGQLLVAGEVETQAGQGVRLSRHGHNGVTSGPSISSTPQNI